MWGSTAGSSGLWPRKKKEAAQDPAVAGQGGGWEPRTLTPLKRDLNPLWEWHGDLAAHKGGGRASCHPLVLRAMRLLAGGVFSLSFHLTGGDMR